MKESETTSRSQHLLGVCLVVFAFFLVAMMNALGKEVLKSVPVSLFLFMQSSVAFVLTAPFVFFLRQTVVTSHIGLHFIRALSGILSYLCLFVALQYISLVNATLLANSAPLFFPFVIWIWMGEKIPNRLWWSLIIGFSGVFLLVNPFQGVGLALDFWMVLLALLGSLFSAIALQSVRNLISSDSLFCINFYYFLIASVLLAPIALYQWVPIKNSDWFLLIGVGFLLFIIQFSLAKAYKYASPTLLGPFNYSVVIFSGIIQWVYWDVIPSFMSVCGVISICLGGILTFIRQGKKMDRNRSSFKS